MPARRSRNGCRECRRRHRRCDETKPTCGYCAEANKLCDYGRELSWGGRPFSKSRFGECMKKDRGVFKASLPTTQHQVDRHDLSDRDGLAEAFVYLCEPSKVDPTPIPTLEPIPTEPDSEEQETEIFASTNEHEDDPTYVPSQYSDAGSTILRGPSNYPGLSFLPPCDCYLLDYFQGKVTQSLACHKGMQAELSSTLIPIALTSRPMLAAVLCTAYCHRLSVGLEHTERRALRLRTIALQHLNATLENGDEHGLVSAFGTSLVLCLSDIVSSTVVHAGWPVHIAGASALLKRGLRRSQSPNFRLLMRLYTSLRSIAASCSSQLDPDPVEGKPEEDESHYIDDLAGFSTSLYPIIQRMHRIDEAVAYGLLDQSCDSHCDFSELCVCAPHQYAELIFDLETMLDIPTTAFRPEICESLSQVDRQDFYLLDKAYHHMVLLQLYSRVEPGSVYCHYSTQTIVAKLVDSISAMQIVDRPCPAVATLPPLFEAGYWAQDLHDRERIAYLLSQTFTRYGMGNVTCTLDFLGKRWANDRETLLSRRGGSIEFLPY